MPPHRASRAHPPRRAIPIALLVTVATAAAAAAPPAAQGVDDGLLLPARTGGIAVDYGHERWSEYWEGGLLRRNADGGN